MSENTTNTPATGNGGPAFPRPQSNGEFKNYDAQEGMTLRDYFAAKAMASLLMADDRDHDETFEHYSSTCATAAYRYADAMLVARKEVAP